jgi:hypothetical protein
MQASLLKFFSVPDKLKGAVRIFDDWSRIWRSAATSLWPAYHTRNAFGNIWNSSIIGPVKSIQPYREARTIQRKFALEQAGKEIKWAKDELKHLREALDAGIVKRNTLSDARDYFMHEGIAHNFWADPAETIGKKLGKHLPMFEPEKVFEASARKLVPSGYKFGIMVENNARLAHFLHMRKAGKTVAESAASVRKYLFNYNELSAFERGIMRRTAFFYTFTRKNTPLMLEHIMKPASRMWAAGVGKTGQDFDDLPEWVKDAGVFVLSKPQGDSEDGLFRTLDLGLPISEFVQPKIMSRLNPLLRVPLEISTNRDFFTGRELSTKTRAPFIVKAAAKILGGENELLQKLTGYKRTDRLTKTGEIKTSETVDPGLNVLFQSTPGSRFFAADPLRHESGAAAFLNAILGVKIRSQEMTNKGIRFNLLGDVVKQLQAQGRIKKFTGLYATDPTDTETKSVVSYLNSPRTLPLPE